MTEERLYGHAHGLHELEPHYSRHVHAMTSEALHSKSDIAAELAWRDIEIRRLRDENAILGTRLIKLLTEASEAPSFIQHRYHCAAVSLAHEEPEDVACTCGRMRLLDRIDAAISALAAGREGT